MTDFRRNTLPSEALLEIKLALTSRFDRWASWLDLRWAAGRFREVEVFCLFIGYPRSGHSVVGSIIDAHADAVAAHRLHALKYFLAGDRVEHLFAMAVRNALRFSRGGRKLTGYAYPIPGLWQGRYERLRVICDQEGERNGLALHRNPDALDRLQRALGGRLRLLHVVRNPYDNITTMAIRSLGTLERTTERYFALCEAVADIKRRVDPGLVLDVRHDELVAAPAREIGRFTAFLRLDPSPRYLAGCTSVVAATPHRSRDKLPWTPALIDRVQQRASRYPWLAGYAYQEAQEVAS